MRSRFDVISTAAVLTGALTMAQGSWAQEPVFALKWGLWGTNIGEFKAPYGIAADAIGNVYVVDRDNHRIQKFDSDGVFLLQWELSDLQWWPNTQFVAIAVDPSGNNLYVGVHLTIYKYDSNGGLLGQWQTSQSALVSGLAVDPSGNVYMVDATMHIVQKYSNNGVLLLQWGSSLQFWTPFGIAVDPSGNVYVADTSNHRIQKFDSNGTFLLQWGSSFRYPSGIAVDPSGNNVYVTELYPSGNNFCTPGGNHRVQKFDSNGAFLLQWGSYGPGNGQFCRARGVAVDPSGNVYVADTGNNRIQKFCYDCTPVTAAVEPSVTAQQRLLGQNAPNPFSGQTKIAFQLAASANVNIEVYDVGGRMVRHLAAGRCGPGPQHLLWDRSDAQKGRLPAGVYSYRLIVDGRPMEEKKAILLH